MTSEQSTAGLLIPRQRECINPAGCSMKIEHNTGSRLLNPDFHIDVITFDLESTLVDDELLQRLAGPTGAELTKAAMYGGMTFRESFDCRLKIAAPTRQQILDEARQAEHLIIPDACDTIAALKKVDVEVGILSGGLGDYVRHMADVLGVDQQMVLANDLIYDNDGKCVGVSDDEMLREGAKGLAIADYISRAGPTKSVVHIGDGKNDVVTEVCPFVRADWYAPKKPALDEAADSVIRMHPGRSRDNASLSVVLQLLGHDRQEYIVREYPDLAARAGIAA